MRQFIRENGLNFSIILVAALIASATFASHGVHDEGVQKRMATMAAAGGALQTLGDMIGGRAIFDRARAKTARGDLIRATRAIPKRFRRPHSDPLSAARPTIWLQWKDFRSKAKEAQRASRALDVGRLEDLRKTLPRLVKACLACHQTYRSGPNS